MTGASMTLNGEVSYETCPECYEPDVKVEHGYDGVGFRHYWHCPNCGDSIAIVCHDCRLCGERKEETA